jgi:hypothetical protein
LVEHWTENPGVAGSTPACGKFFMRERMRRLLLFGLAFLALCGCAATPGGEGPTWTGYIYGETTKDRFDLIAPSDNVTVRFKVPDESHFYVGVYGKTGNPLGDFDLSKGDTIELTGGGKFSLEMYSRGDSGYWAATLIE